MVDPVPDTRRLATFLGLCYTDSLVANVTRRNTQQHYEEAGLSEIQHVPVVRPPSRPKDVETGFLQELGHETLAGALSVAVWCGRVQWVGAVGVWAGWVVGGCVDWGC